MADAKLLLRDYGRDFDDECPPISAADLERHLELSQPRSARGSAGASGVVGHDVEPLLAELSVDRRRSARRRWPYVAVGAAAAVLLAIVLFLPRGDGSEEGNVATGDGQGPVESRTLTVQDLEWVEVALDSSTFEGSILLASGASDSVAVLGGAVGDDAAIWTSDDRDTWNRVPHDEAIFGGDGEPRVEAVVPWGTGFVAVGRQKWCDAVECRYQNLVWRSADGFAWELSSLGEVVSGQTPGSEEVFLAVSDDQLVIVGHAVWTSTDGVTWQQSQQPPLLGDETVIESVSGAADGFLAVGGVLDDPGFGSGWSAAVWASSDGSNWEQLPVGEDLDGASLFAVTFAETGWAALGTVGQTPAAWTSSNGTDWTRATINYPAETRVTPDWSVATGQSGLVAVGPHDQADPSMTVLLSPDGRTWEAVTSPESIARAGLSSVTAFGPHFVAAGTFDGSSIWTTSDPGEALQNAQVEPTVTDVIEVGGWLYPEPIAVGDAVWVVDSDGGTVSRIDAESREVTDTIAVGARGLESATDAVWVSAAGGGVLARVDLTSREVTQRIYVGPPYGTTGTVHTDGALWSQSNERGMVRVDLESPYKVDEYPLPGGTGPAWWSEVIDGTMWSFNGGDRLSSFDLDDREFADVFEVTLGTTEECCIAVDGAIWLVHHWGAVKRFDLMSHEITDELHLGGGTVRGIAAAGALWIPNMDDSVVYRIDPELRVVTDVIPVGDQPWKPAFADGAIWVPSQGDGTVSRIDVESRQVTHTVEVGNRPRTPVSFDGAIWVNNLGDGTVTRIQTR